MTFATSCMADIKKNHLPENMVAAEPILALEDNDGHFNVITSLKGYFRTSYFCPTMLEMRRRKQTKTSLVYHFQLHLGVMVHSLVECH